MRLSQVAKIPKSALIKLSSPQTREYWEIPVLYEDEHLLALDKPACLLTSPDRYDPQRPNLMRLLHDAIAQKKPWATERGLDYLMNAHRLDFETTGILLLAKSKPVLVALANLFSTARPNKLYHALVHGVPEETTWEIDAPIAPHPFQTGLMRVDRKHGKHAATRFEVMEQYRNHALILCQPFTGRTHQIRVHLRHCGHPICGDSLYGGAPIYLSALKPNYRLRPGHTERPLIATVALHAAQLEFPHPITGVQVIIKSEWPRDFAVAVKYLRRHAAIV